MCRRRMEEARDRAAARAVSIDGSGSVTAEAMPVPATAAAPDLNTADPRAPAGRSLAILLMEMARGCA